MNAKALTSALKSNPDATRTLTQFLYDAEPPILDYNMAMGIPVRCPAISKAIQKAWDAGRDEVGDALAEVENDAPKFVNRVWDALLDD